MPSSGEAAERQASPLSELLSLYCYVQPLANARLLIWYEVAKWDAPRHPRIVFTLIDLRMLEVLDDPPATAEKMKASKERVYFSGGDAVFCESSATLDAGLHPISAPAAVTTSAKEAFVSPLGTAKT
jgi:hypothetical protein